MKKIVSWNINGFKSALDANHLQDILYCDYDIICLQEVKLSDITLLKRHVPSCYNVYYNLSTIKGRNGVVILSKMEAISIKCKLGNEKFDNQGRFIQVEYPEFSLINLYMPHGRRDKSELEYKLEVADLIVNRLCLQRNNKLLIATDFNIAHNEIDVCRATQNHNNIMFTDAERAVIAKISKVGYYDVFRNLYPQKIAYTWWSYAFDCRSRNIGWRIDYFFASRTIMEKITDLNIMHTHLGSDHCPIVLSIEVE